MRYFKGSVQEDRIETFMPILLFIPENKTKGLQHCRFFLLYLRETPEVH